MGAPSGKVKESVREVGVNLGARRARWDDGIGRGGTDFSLNVCRLQRRWYAREHNTLERSVARRRTVGAQLTTLQIVRGVPSPPPLPPRGGRSSSRSRCRRRRQGDESASDAAALASRGGRRRRVRPAHRSRCLSAAALGRASAVRRHSPSNNDFFRCGKKGVVRHMGEMGV